MQEPADTVRLFYALWPDELTRRRLVALQTGIGGRKVAEHNLHLTLAFLGNQPRDSIGRLAQVMQALTLPAMRVCIDHYGYFSKPRIAWVGPSAPPDALITMQAALREALLETGVRLKPVAGFRPHITLARDAVSVNHTLSEAFVWTVSTITLLQSVAIPGGVEYQSLAQRQF